MGSVLRTLTIISRVKIPRKMYIQMSIAFFSCNVRKLLWGLPSVRKGIMKFFSWLDQVFKFGLKSFGMRCSFSRKSVLTSKKSTLCSEVSWISSWKFHYFCYLQNYWPIVWSITAAFHIILFRLLVWFMDCNYFLHARNHLVGKQNVNRQQNIQPIIIIKHVERIVVAAIKIIKESVTYLVVTFQARFFQSHNHTI